jgi:hypothetical protein
MVVIGGISFLIGNIGARTGLVSLSFDPHHVVTQLGGSAIALIGLMVASGT